MRRDLSTAAFSGIEAPPLCVTEPGCLTDRYKLKLFLVAALWISLNLTLNFANKLILGEDKLNLAIPITYTASHSFLALLASSVALLLRPERLSAVEPSKLCSADHTWAWLLALSTLFMAQVVLQNVSFVSVDLVVVSVFKSSVPLLLLLLSMCIECKTYSMAITLTIVAQVAGGALTLTFEDEGNPLTRGQPNGPPLIDATQRAWGYAQAVLSTLALAASPVVSARVMRDKHATGLTPLLLVWCNALLATLVLLPLGLVTEWRALAGDGVARPAATVGLLVGGAIAGAAYQLVTLVLIDLSSSLSYAVIGGVKQVLLISGAGLFIDGISYNRSGAAAVLPWLGVALFLAASLTYSWLLLADDSARLEAARKAGTLHNGKAGTLEGSFEASGSLEPAFTVGRAAGTLSERTPLRPTVIKHKR